MNLTREMFPGTTVERYKALLPDAKYKLLVAATTDTQAEIAAAMSIAQGTVKSRLNRARKALQKLIDADRREDNQAKLTSAILRDAT